MARTGVLSNRRRLEGIFNPPRRSIVDKEAEVEHLVRVRNIKACVVLLLVWENPDAMAYVRHGDQ